MALKRAERLRQATITEIKTIARRQMAEQGEAALSLGAIAREMGMTTPALYRYFENRDALVTALLVDAFTGLADALDAADAAQPTDRYGRRFRAVALAYREWAIAHRHDYALIYGTPIPGYHAPQEVTVPVATRILLTLGMLLLSAFEAGALFIPEVYRTPPPALRKKVVEIVIPISKNKHAPAVLLLTCAVRVNLNGLVWAELFEQLPPGVAEGGELYRIEVEGWCERLGWSVRPRHTNRKDAA